METKHPNNGALTGLWPEFRRIIDKDRESGHPGVEALPVDRARQVMAAALLRWGGTGPPMSHVRVRSLSVRGGRVRTVVYTPELSTAPLPVLAYIHGGGFVLGSPETHDALVRQLAACAHAVVVSIEYRLAPEHRFPQPVLDCLAVAEWLQTHAAEIGGDPGRIGIAGDSAGGTLAASVCLEMHSRGLPPLKGQFLFYPAMASACETPSWGELGENFFLKRATMRWFWENYLGPDLGGDGHAEPLLAPDLRNLPPAMIIFPALDPLKDEGSAYADKLEASGVPVNRFVRDGAIHGYLGMRGISPGAHHDLAMLGTAIGDLLRDPPRSER